ncbi:hypothetical protein OPV22_019605 [Ensete ventricosum]|uniref:Uncharacterized protein n=1 Tax=Ensete ventricosum TaxID=4639 RepID=A0AAV8QGR9_ENSVE|nr:hypothetical protein OPV22_019605 [Ensete ventricosum]
MDRGPDVDVVVAAVVEDADADIGVVEGLHHGGGGEVEPEDGGVLEVESGLGGAEDEPYVDDDEKNDRDEDADGPRGHEERAAVAPVGAFAAPAAATVVAAAVLSPLLHRVRKRQLFLACDAVLRNDPLLMVMMRSKFQTLTQRKSQLVENFKI